MLKKSHRLAKTTDVQRVFAQGRAFFNPIFTVKFLRGGQSSRFTVVVSTKVSKKAVARNQIKRQIREFIRLNLGKFAKGDYAIVAKPLAAKQEKSVLVAKFKEVLLKFKLMES